MSVSFGGVCFVIVAGFRSYFPAGGLGPGDRVPLGEAESRHLVKALRARAGDAVTLFDGLGGAWQATLLESSGGAATVEVSAQMPLEPPVPAVSLGVAMLKGKTMDLVVKLAVEIGVSSLTPLVTTRSEVRLDPKRAQAKRAHWQVTAIESAKQSGNLWPPVINEPMSLEHWLWAQAGADVRLVASLEPDARPVATLLPAGARSLAALVGPEGDFAPEEYVRAAGQGFAAARLGRHVLRAETAVACLLAVIDAYRARS